MRAMCRQCVERAQPLDMDAVCKALIVHGACGEEAGQRLLDCLCPMATRWCCFLILVLCVFETFSAWFGNPVTPTVRFSDLITYLS